jgi:glycosyltransferase involved in cell wall biosynthesis
MSGQERGTPGRPLVSIVTPTLNQSAYLLQTIASVRAQTYTSIEHIVVDGGSTDGTIQLLHQLDDDPRIEWTSEPDEGMYHAINKGLARARGDIVTYLNSDDLLMPWTVERVVREFDRHLEVELVYGDALRYLQDIDRFDLILQPRFRFSTLGRTGSLVQPAVFWRRRLMERVGSFDTKYRLSADLEFWLRASGSTAFFQVDEVLAVERAHAEAQTARLRSRLGTEAGMIRGRFHPDGPLRLPLKIGARLLDGVAARVRMVQFVMALLRGTSTWLEFRRACHPVVLWPWLAVAMVTPRPLVGTSGASVAMKLFRRRWLAINPGSLWGVIDGRPPNPEYRSP